MKTIISLSALMIISILSLHGQSFNHEIKTEGNSPILIGKINKDGLTQEPYSEWFLKNYSGYTLKQGILDSLKTRLNQYTITLFMGTWCGDSKREVPHFYKIIESAGFPIERLTVIAVDRNQQAYKQSHGGEHEGMNIHRVPTFIFYKDGKEINRIIESPKKTLEEDILSILWGNYIPKYESVWLMNDILSKNGSDYLSKNVKKLIKKFENKTANLYELNTYANVLFFAHKKEEAMAVLDFNTTLFPKEANVYVSLANKYLYKEDPNNAIKYYKKSLEFADNEEIRGKIQELKIVKE